MLLYRPGDWVGECEELLCFLRKLGIRRAMFAAEMTSIFGHSGLLMAPNTDDDNNHTQQSTGDIRSGRQSARILAMGRSQNVWFIAIVCMWSVMDERSLAVILQQQLTPQSTLSWAGKKVEATNILWEDFCISMGSSVFREGWLASRKIFVIDSTINYYIIK